MNAENGEPTPDAAKRERDLIDAARRQAAGGDTAPFVPDDALDTDGVKIETRPRQSVVPNRIGRYAIQDVLGKGGFGVVYLARDTELNRLVALKVSKSERFSSSEELEQFVGEARTAAQFDHPGIVPVYDISRDDDQAVIVQKYIEGQDLASHLKSHELPAERAAELMTAVAEAIAYAHQKGFVHRDLKPSNILLDKAGRPHVADLGLAIHENVQRRHSGETSGTPAYMSPEQVRGETHRLDGRSDIWSLGVILYEMLAGRRPFSGDDFDELFDEIQHRDPKPPSQLKPELPAELERICLKCLSKRITDRYSGAAALARDLRHWLTSGRKEIEPGREVEKAKIVPKGLRSFEAEDADFFLDLLPGPRDRDSLPESIRFWKTRIDQTDADETFSVGLIYGPSGCGKSSLIKAGLLPRLADHVVPIYVEATAGETESRLLRALRKRCPDVTADLNLIDTVAALRQGEGLAVGTKIFIVLDQFEQWLHAKQQEENTELVRVLRHCDGEHVQCVVMVRDDFWLAVSRFMQELEIRVLEGHNSRLVDLFDQRHARKVLAAFGRAYGALPGGAGEPIAEQLAFLDQATAELASDGRVICVRLALFSEMVKSKPWTPATLNDVGGTEGVGVTFLEETFSASTAPPEHRLHQKAARSVLKTLLPASGTDIKGSMRSFDELLEASGYAQRRNDFDELIHILDSEVRLITPIDPAGQETDDDSDLHADPTQKYYQLTHDYLVPSLRTWLTKKQRETRRGRAELRLAERLALWKAKPEDQQLPPAWEYVNIRALTRKRDWTDVQRRMMSAATRYYAMRTAALGVLIIMLAWGGRQMYAHTNSSALVNSLLNAEESKVLEIVDDLQRYMPWVREDLQQLARLEPKTADETRQQLHARLALVATDENQVPALFEALLTASPGYVGVIRDALRTHKEKITENLWQEFRTESGSTDRRFRAVIALADFVPGSEEWKDDDYQFLAEQLLLENFRDQPVWLEHARPVSDRCISHWERLFSDTESSELQLLGTAYALKEFAGDDQKRIARLLTVANPKQYKILFPLIASSPDEATKSYLAKTATELPPVDLSSVDRVPFGQRRAGAGITLLRLSERESVLPTFDMTDDPEALTQFIHRCRDRGIRAEELLECLRLAASSSLPPQASNRTRYALLLALGEYPLSDIPKTERESLIRQLSEWHEHDPSSVVHGATGWLLRQWGQDEIVRRVDQTAVPYSANREWFTLAITVTSPWRAHTSKTTLYGGVSTEKEQSTPSPDVEPAASSDDNSEKAPTDDADTSDDPSAGNEPREQNSPTADTEKADDSDASSGDVGQSEKKSEFVPQTFYLTFIVFPAGEYYIGSTIDELERVSNETQHIVTITRPFALLDRELTFAELIAFDRGAYAGIIEKAACEPTDAAFGPDWYDAVAYCRWLTEHGGLLEEDQAYLDPTSLDEKQFPREPDPRANWAPRDWPVRLNRRGFRLPTEAEWEVACRAECRTAYGQGADVNLLRHYAWYSENSEKHVHPPKTRRPGLRGLFDMHGNLYEWVHDWYPDTGTGRVYRGGSWSSYAGSCRSSLRYYENPAFRGGLVGFRLAFLPCSKDAEGQESSDSRGAETRRERDGAATGGSAAADGSDSVHAPH